MHVFTESTWAELYQSAVDAFPNTTRRQYAIDPISVSDLTIVPFVRFHTLFIRATATNEDRQYRPMVLVRNVDYHETSQAGDVQFTASNGNQFWIAKPALDVSHVMLRCSCKDFYWRFNYYDHLDHSLYGRVRAPYEALANPGSANPHEMPGACKHLMKMMLVLSNSGIFN